MTNPCFIHLNFVLRLQSLFRVANHETIIKVSAVPFFITFLAVNGVVETVHLTIFLMLFSSDVKL